MEVLQSDDEVDEDDKNANFNNDIPRGVYGGISATFEIRLIQSPFVNDKEKLLDIMRVIARYNEFDISQTIVHNTRNPDGGVSVIFMGDDSMITMRADPKNKYITLHIQTTVLYETHQRIFDIYDFLVEALDADYDCRDINIVDHIM
jgi:hypothetical protein